MSMKKVLTLLIALMSFAAVEAQEHSILIYESSFMPESGLAIDKIGQDPSKRDCARIKMHINRMTSTEIDQLKVVTIGGTVKVTKQYVSLEGDGLIIELTAKPSSRFFLHHDKYGDSNIVDLNLEGNREYRISAELKVFYPIVISCDAREAEVFIDDAFQGRISDDYTLTIKDIVPGMHKLKVKSGTAVAEKSIDVNSDNIYFRVEVNETPSLPQYVLFNVTPKDAIVVVNDKSYSTDAEGVAQAKLYNGQYTYRASAPGYHDAKDTFTVNGEKVEINITLKPAHGWVSIESTTALQGASVYIDGVRIGNAPIKSNKLASGKHTIKILKDLYEPYEDTITIKDGETLKYTPTLTANFATVTVTTSEGADIYIDNKKKGTTTWTGDLETGLYVFEARKANHTPTQLPKEITAQPQKQKITLNAPKPIMGSIDITSSPTKASVYIDSKYVGETPLMTNLIIGPHKVKVSKKEYVSETSQVNIKQGKTEILSLTLKEDIAPACLQITSYPQNANVYIDGDYVGTTPLNNYNVERGKHKIKVTSSGYSSETQEVTVNGGDKPSLFFSLEESFGRKTKKAVSNAVDGVADTVGDAFGAVGDAFGAVGDGIVDAVDTILDSDSFNIGPSIGFGLDVSNLDLGSGYSGYYGGGYYGGYYDYYYSAKNSTTRSSSDDSDGEVGGEFSIGLLWRLWGYDTLFNVHTGIQYTFASERTFLSIPAVVNLNLYDDYWDYAMYLGLGTDFSFVHDNSNSDYYSGDTYQGLQCPFIFQYGIGARHHDVCFYIKAYFDNDSVYMGMRYSYLF